METFDFKVTSDGVEFVKVTLNDESVIVKKMQMRNLITVICYCLQLMNLREGKKISHSPLSEIGIILLYFRGEKLRDLSGMDMVLMK